jgi:hypothetical protein
MFVAMIDLEERARACVTLAGCVVPELDATALEAARQTWLAPPAFTSPRAVLSTWSLRGRQFARAVRRGDWRPAPEPTRVLALFRRHLLTGTDAVFGRLPTRPSANQVATALHQLAEATLAAVSWELTKTRRDPRRSPASLRRARTCSPGSRPRPGGSAMG